MARYRNEDDDREYYPRDEQRLRREAYGSYSQDEPMTSRREYDRELERRADYGRVRLGERAEYDYD